MEDLVNSMKGTALKVGGWFTPVLKESKFKETGMLTPEEFVAAGDNMVHHCPTWQWSAGDPSMMAKFLPPDKQFLVTRNVPCYRRVKQMEYSTQQEKVIESDDPDGGWIDTHYYNEGDCNALADAAKGLSLDRNAEEHIVSATAETEDDQEVVDLEDLIEHRLHDAEDPYVVKPAEVAQAAASNVDNVLATRTYDLNITYDHYYRTPRMWLMGYDEKKTLLTVNQMYEDFSQDHAKKTITMETHPHIPGPPMASIHPCRHAEVMKKLIDTFEESGRQMGVHQYLLIFLKFVQAVIPTIEYDFTSNVNV